MSITDELREFIAGADGYELWCPRHKDELTSIADHIDEEHEKALRKEFIRVYTSDADMEHDGWIRLPRDADNEIVNVGDKLDGYNKTIEVMWLRLGRTGWWIIDEYGKSYACCDAFLHHREPTVEDVLDEFASAYDRIGGEDEEHQKYLDLIAEYAAKLQLRSVEE